MFCGHYVFLAEIGLERRKASHTSQNQITTGNIKRDQICGRLNGYKVGSPEFLWYYAIRSPPVYTHTFHVSAQAPKSLNTFFGVELEGHEASPSLFSISAYALL